MTDNDDLDYARIREDETLCEDCHLVHNHHLEVCPECDPDHYKPWTMRTLRSPR